MLDDACSDCVQGEVRTVGREKWTLASGGRIMAVRSQVSNFPILCREFYLPKYSFGSLYVYLSCKELFVLITPKEKFTKSRIGVGCGSDSFRGMTSQR